jgi:hypothetical protein
MRKIIIFVCLILSGFMILDSLNMGQALMMFLLAGVIPGTNIAISAQVMVEFFALVSGFVFARLTSRFLAPLLRRLPAGRHA